PAEILSFEDLQEQLSRVCGRLLDLLQTLVTVQAPLQLWIATRGAWGVAPDFGGATPAQAALWGLGRVLALEHPQLRPVLIDLSPGSDAAEVAAALADELGRRQGGEQVAWRRGQRFVARLVRWAGHTGAPARFRAAGTYLVTGGLGGLGLRLARWLVEHGAHSLALVGRSAPAEPARQALEELRRSGAEVLVLQADISRAEEVAQVLARCAQALPPLRGVFHLAGVLDDGVLARQSWQRLCGVLAGKAGGAWHLHQQTRALPLE